MIRSLFSTSLLPYHFLVAMTLTMAGILLGQFISEPLPIFIIMLVSYIFIILILLHFFHQQVKFVQRAIRTIDQLAKGNYHIRLDYQVNDHFALLNQKTNYLAQHIRAIVLEKQMQTEQLSTVIDHIESALLLIDERGYIHLVNQSFLNMFGEERKLYVGQLYYKVFKEETIHEIVQETFLYEESRKKSFSFASENGILYFQLVSAPVVNEQNVLKGTVLVFYNITEMKKLELMRKDFVANVSHELKTPITSIRGFAETLLEGALHNQEVSEQFLGIIHDESKRLQTLIDHLLTLTKLEQDEPQLHMRKVNLELLLTEISPLIKQMVTKKSITYTEHIDNNLIIYGDQGKLKQMFINLFTNAVHYTPEYGQITLLAKLENSYIQIQITDTGIGISEEDLPRIFERFYRVDKARSRNTGGTGLGLSIVKHIVEGHSGEIAVKSTINNGTTFTIQLPTELTKDF